MTEYKGSRYSRPQDFWYWKDDDVDTKQSDCGTVDECSSFNSFDLSSDKNTLQQHKPNNKCSPGAFKTSTSFSVISNANKVVDLMTSSSTSSVEDSHHNYFRENYFNVTSEQFMNMHDTKESALCLVTDENDSSSYQSTERKQKDNATPSERVLRARRLVHAPKCGCWDCKSSCEPSKKRFKECLESETEAAVQGKEEEEVTAAVDTVESLSCLNKRRLARRATLSMDHAESEENNRMAFVEDLERLYAPH